MVVMNLSKQDILELAAKYDEDYPWWTSEEKRIGDQLRRDSEFGMDTLKEIIHWKFKSLPGREKRVNNLINQYGDQKIRQITIRILPLPTSEDLTKIQALCEPKGIGVAIASTILTFHNPQDYCVYDIHVMRGVYGKEPKHMFTGFKHYLKLLKDLREYSTRVNLPVRTIEKALFKKNIDSSRNL